MRGKVGMGVQAAGMSQNHFANPFNVVENVIIPESQNAEATAVQFRIASYVVCRPCMLPTVDFNDDACSNAREVDDVRADRPLAPESHARKLFPLQFSPKP
jgi:hypothetical protein